MKLSGTIEGEKVSSLLARLFNGSDSHLWSVSDVSEVDDALKDLRQVMIDSLLNKEHCYFSVLLVKKPVE